MCIGVLFVCLFVHHMRATPMKARRGHHTLREFQTCVSHVARVVGTEFRSSGKAANVHNC